MKPKIHICEMCGRVMHVADIKGFRLDVLTMPGDPDERGVRIYPLFKIDNHSWRVEENTAEVRVWDGLPDPIVIIDRDEAILNANRACFQCFGHEGPLPKSLPYAQLSQKEKQGRQQLAQQLDAHRKSHFGHMRIRSNPT